MVKTYNVVTGYQKLICYGSNVRLMLVILTYLFYFSRSSVTLSLLALLTCLTDEGCDLHRLISLTFRPSVCQLSVVVPS